MTKSSICVVLLFMFLLTSAVIAHQRMNILIRMTPDQEIFFKDSIIEKFEKENAVKVRIIDYSNTDSIESYLQKYAGKIHLIKVPFDKSRVLMSKGLLKPLDSFLSPENLKSFNETYLLTSLGMMDGRQTLLPRKFETRILVYRKSKVSDAILKWPGYKDQINNFIKAFNGYGLPSGYILEENPDEWDYFDIAVVGWIWAHSEYNGKMLPRVGHRGKKYSGTSLRIIDRIFQLNGDSSNVLTCSGDAVIDALYWEAFYAAANIYNKKMWEEGWSGSDLWKGFSENEVFLGFMTQLDCFYLHGTGHDKLTGYLKEPSDLGVALMPAACAMELDSGGISLRKGTRSVTTGGWWWAIPYNAPNGKSGYKLASAITDSGSQVRECSHFGMIPVRKDIINDITKVFPEQWMKEVYETSFRQLMINGTTVLPDSPYFDKISNLYLDMWYDIVANKNWSSGSGSPEWWFIKNRIETKYAPAASSILSGQK